MTWRYQPPEPSRIYDTLAIKKIDSIVAYFNILDQGWELVDTKLGISYFRRPMKEIQ